MSHLQQQVLFTLTRMIQNKHFCIIKNENEVNCMQENQRIALTKRLLKEGLIRLLQKKDIEKIGVSELCAESGINRATFYRHYEIPLDILREIQNDFMTEIDLPTREPKNVQEIADNFERICCFLKQNELITKALLKTSTDQELSILINKYSHILLNSTYKDKIDEESTRLVLKGLAGGAIALLRAWILEDSNKTPKELAELLVFFISYGSKLY